MNSATAGGDITATGGADATVRGIEYSTTDGFTNGTGTQVTDSGTFGTGSFTRSLAGLSAGTTYYFKSFATNSAGTSYGAQEGFLTLPAAPAAPTASAVGPTGFTVNWDSVTSATSYRLDVAADSSFTSMVVGYDDLTVAGTSEAVTGLAPSTTYYARVRAVNATGTGANSGMLTQATDAATSPTITITGAPDTLFTTVGTASSSTSVSVSGVSLTADITATAPSSDFQVSSDDSSWASTATFTQTAGDASGTLYIRLSASAAVGSPSGNVTLTSTDATPQVVAVSGTVIKAEPTNHVTDFAAGTITTTNIPATWTPASPEPDGYLIKVSSTSITDPVDGTDPTDDSDVSNGSAQVKVTPGSASSFSGFTGFAAGTTYTFAIFPYNNSGTAINFKTTGAPSFSAVLLPAAPDAPTFASVSEAGFTVEWGAVTGADDYRLDVATDSGFTSLVSGYDDLTVAGLSQAVSGLDANTEYHARVRAMNATGTSANSTSASQTTNQLPAPVANAASAVGITGFTANWDAVSGASGYRLDVYNRVPGTTTTETFTDIGGGTISSYLTRSWTGDGGISWTAYKARTDQVITTGDSAITLRDEAGSYLESDEISDGVNSISFDVRQVFSGSGGTLTVKVLHGPSFATETVVGTINYTTTADSFSETVAGVTGNYKIRIDNNAVARPVIDNLAFTSADVLTPLTGFEDLDVGNVTAYAVTGASSETNYSYVVRATSSSSTSENSNEISVTTAGLAPTVATGTVGSITRTAATIFGSDVSSGGTSAITERGVVISTSANPTTADTKFTVSGTTGVFDADLAGLTTNTPYFVRAFATNGVGTSYGDEIEFTPVNALPGFEGMSVSTVKGSSVNILLGKILAKASDADGDTVTVSAVTAATAEGGTATLGATAITYTPAAGFDGSDTLTFTLSDGFGTVDHTISITVSEDPLFTSGGNAPRIAELPNGDKRIAFNGIPGRTYGIQRSTTMAAGSWTQIAAVTAASDSTVVFEDDDPPAPSAFYRIAYPAE